MNKQISFYLQTIGVLLMFTQSAWAVTCTSVATTKTDWNKGNAWAQPACGGGEPPAGATVFIAQNTNILADANTLNVASITVQAGGTLAIKAGNSISFSGNFTNNGTFTAPTNSTVALTGINQTITGNVTFANLTVAAGTQLTLAGNIVVTGTSNVAAGNIVSTCPTNYTITNQTTGAVQNSCNTAGGGGNGGGNTCSTLLPALPPGGNPPVASGGTTAMGTGTNVNGAPVTMTAGSNTILSPATTTTWNSGSTALAAPPSPIPTSTIVTTVGAAGLAAGSYGDVRVTTGTGSFSGGNYFINELYVAPGATAQLAPGDYYLNKLTVGSSITKTGGSITVSPAGLVRIFVKTNAKGDAALYGGSSGIWDSSTINVGGNPANLQVLLYDTVSYFEIGNNTQFTGFVVQPVYSGAAGNKAIDVHQGTTITGGVYTAGLLNIKNNVTFNYNAQVSAAITSMSQCAGPHHFEIQHASGTGLTCAASTLTVKACADSAVPCVTPYTSGVSGTLSATGTPTVNWDGTTGGAAGADFVIPSGSSSVTKDVQVATAGTVTFGVSTATPIPTGATTCNFGDNAPGNNNCVFTASAAGFLFSDTATGNSYTIPPQVSGIATPTLYLRALQAATNNPAVCTPAIIGQTTAVNMGYTCNNPATCQAGNLATINTTPIAQAGTAVSLTFDANGSAPITARYDDVGQITLDASKTTTPFGGATPVTLNGNSNAFVVAPHHFGFSAVTGPFKAGNDFSATVTAYNGLATPTPTATHNFGKETTPEGVTLSFSKCQPTGANSVNGTFSGTVGAFSGGEANSANLNWDEVGNGDLVATLASGSYLGSGLTATGSTGTDGTACNGAGNVGAFIPDHFITAVVNGCLGCGFTYSGQPFTVSVTAMNGLATPTTTVNYDGTANTTPTFANDVTLTDANALAIPVGKLGVSAAAMGETANAAGTTLTVPKADFTKGVATLTSVPTYTFNAVTTAPTIIKMHAVDAVNNTVTSAAVEGTTEIRSGRIKVSNAYGSEQLPLTLTATAQYYSGAAWLTSTTDSATSFNTNLSTAAGDIVQSIIKSPLTGITVSGPGVTKVKKGVALFKLDKPGVSGAVDISVNAPPYLSTSGVAGRATFGIYKGANEFIYLRESY